MVIFPIAALLASVAATRSVLARIGELGRRFGPGRSSYSAVSTGRMKVRS